MWKCLYFSFGSRNTARTQPWRSRDFHRVILTVSMTTLESRQRVVHITHPCPLMNTTVTILASHTDNLCPVHILSTPVPQCQAEQRIPPPTTHTQTHTRTLFSSTSHHTGTPSCLDKWEKRRVTIAVLDHGLDTDWRHCPPCPQTDNGLPGEHNDCAAGGGRCCV